MNSVQISQSTPVFAKIGLLSFGGPAAQIALMHKILVEEKKWLTEQQFLSAISFCMLLPGPEAMQLATYAGWKMHGTKGGLIAGLLFVLPGACVILALAFLYAKLGNIPVMQAIFLGIKAAVLIVVLEALIKVSKRALLSNLAWWIAGFAFIGIFFFAIPFPLIILLAACTGALFMRSETVPSSTPAKPVPIMNTVRTVFIWLIVWWAPVLAITFLSGTPILSEISFFFSKLAVVTFGGAYAVLAYMGQDVVTQFGWLTAGEMMDGLGLAETTPGPLILVTEFVGFIAGFRDGGIWLGLIGALVTLWVTFAPCFLWIFAGAPYIDAISRNPRLSGALLAITAAVVGVILNLSIWFALHVLFGEVSVQNLGPITLWMPDLLSFDWRVLLIGILCGVLLLKLHFGLIKTLGISALLGLVLSVF